VAHAAKFVPPGSKRIASAVSGSLHNVAFKTPADKIVLIVMNDGKVKSNFNVELDGKWFTSSLDAGDVATFIWQS
jgi:glucosylceramidase